MNKAVIKLGFSQDYVSQIKRYKLTLQFEYYK